MSWSGFSASNLRFIAGRGDICLQNPSFARISGDRGAERRSEPFTAASQQLSPLHGPLRLLISHLGGSQQQNANTAVLGDPALGFGGRILLSARGPTPLGAASPLCMGVKMLPGQAGAASSAGMDEAMDGCCGTGARGRPSGGSRRGGARGARRGLQPAPRAEGLTAAILFAASLQMIQHNKTYNSLLEKKKVIVPTATVTQPHYTHIY